MGTEIERKFLVVGDQWRSLGQGIRYCQGYLSTQPTVRARIAGDKGYLTIKGPSDGVSRAEFEYPIPLDDAQAMLDTLCQRPWVEKIRTKIPIGDLVWEVDEFMGDNRGLILAEIELNRPDQTFALPHWIGKEVSGDSRYFNSYLVKHPFNTWPTK
ncbi:MAG: CYTH domain-containing protein [Cyanobacteria bacterium P01_A01_bin.123]